MVQELCHDRRTGGVPPDISLQVGCLASKSRTKTSFSNPCLPYPPNTTSQDPLRHERVWPHRPGGDDLTLTRCHSGCSASRFRTKVSSIGCISTPSPPNRTSLFPAAHALKLHRDGSTAPLTVNFLQQTASRVVSSLAKRTQPNFLVINSKLPITSLPHKFWQTIFRTCSFFVNWYILLQTDPMDATSLGVRRDNMLCARTSSDSWRIPQSSPFVECSSAPSN
uniref:Uncharacterized protein n=1 Tax=Opuntia streptacantha TaxID=393608 RepID=A0A7C8YI13_OPUST